MDPLCAFSLCVSCVRVCVVLLCVFPCSPLSLCVRSSLGRRARPPRSLACCLRCVSFCVHLVSPTCFARRASPVACAPIDRCLVFGCTQAIPATESRLSPFRGRSRQLARCAGRRRGDVSFGTSDPRGVVDARFLAAHHRAVLLLPILDALGGFEGQLQNREPDRKQRRLSVVAHERNAG